MRNLILLLVVLLTSGNALANTPPYQPQEGDFIFQSLPRNPLINAIEGMTRSPYSHCGIVKQSPGGWVVLEALGTVHETPLRQWVDQGRNKTFVVARPDAKLQQQMFQIIQAAARLKGLPYDIHYSLDDKAIYCSELIYKATLAATGTRLGKLEKLGSMPWQPHEQLIRSIENGKLPLEREMVTPVSILRDQRVTQIYPATTSLTPQRKAPAPN